MTRFRGMPLFGKDSSPLYTSTILSAISTFAACAVFFVVVLVVKPVKKPEIFKEVQILFKPEPEDKYEDVALTSSFTEIGAKKSDDNENPVFEPESMNFPESDNIDNPEMTYKESAGRPVVPAKDQGKEHHYVSQPEEHTSNAIDSKYSENTYALDPMEAFNQQIAKEDKDIDWDSMGDNGYSFVSSGNSDKKVINESYFSGNVGKSIKENVNFQEKEDKTIKEKKNNVSDETRKALDDVKTSDSIQDNQPGNKNNNNQQNKQNVGKLVSGGITFDGFDGGENRQLIYPGPENLSIKLPDNVTGSVLGSNVSVEIKFTVLENGYVGRVEIIKGGSLLLDEVKNEIISQLQTWRFAESSHQSTAHLTYKIIKK